MGWLQRLIRACREGDFGHYGMLILISAGILATFSILGCGGGAGGGGGCGGTSTTGSIGNYESSPPTLLLTVTTVNAKASYQPAETVTLLIQGSWEFSGEATFQWTPPEGGMNYVFQNVQPAPGGPPFHFNNISPAEASTGIRVSYSAPTTAPQGKFTDTVVMTDPQRQQQTVVTPHMLATGSGTPPEMPKAQASDDPPQSAMAAMNTWGLMQMTTVNEAYTEADCFNMMTQGQTSNLFMAYRVPVGYSTIPNIGYPMPLVGNPHLTLHAGGEMGILPLVVRPDATTWINDHLPAVPGTMWLALGLDPNEPFNCPAADDTDYSLETYIEFNLGGLPQSCEGCTLYTDICYNTASGAGTPALVEDLAKTFGAGFRAINVGDHTCIGPAETMLHANSNWQLDAQTSSLQLKPGNPILIHYTLYGRTDASQVFNFTHSSNLSGAAWVVHPALDSDPTQPDLTKTITSPITLAANDILELYITSTAPAGTAANNYTYALNLSTSTAGSDPTSTRGSTLLIVTPTGALPEMRSTDAVVALSGAADKATARQGQPLTYQFIVRNTGAVALTNLVLTDTLPANTTYVSCSGGDACALASGKVTWNLANLGAGQQRTMTLAVTVNYGLAQGAKITNSTYAVQTGQGVSASGTAIQTSVDPSKVFLPMLSK